MIFREKRKLREQNASLLEDLKKSENTVLDLIKELEGLNLAYIHEREIAEQSLSWIERVYDKYVQRDGTGVLEYVAEKALPHLQRNSDKWRHMTVTNAEIDKQVFGDISRSDG